jgi:hypothetical protein
MTLYDMFSLIKYVTNKDFGGNIITPEKFKDFIKVVNIDHFRNKYGLPEEYQPGRPVPKEYVEITLKNTDDLKAFKVYLTNVPVVNGKINYPADYAHRDEIIYNFVKVINKVSTLLPRGVEILREGQFATRLGNYTKRPTLLMPVGVVRQDGIYIYPSVASPLNPVPITVVNFAYYRWPHDPVFTYVIGDGFITYDTANSTEYEWPVDEHLTLVAMILKYVGINLRQEEIVQIANQQIQTGQ